MSVLLFSRTTGFRHESIPAGITTFRELRDDIVATEDPAAVEDLAGFDAVVFLNTNGEVLTSAGRAALEAYVRGGGGFLGVHSAAATEYGWPFYGELVGAWFDKHPAVQPATITVSDPDHPATADLPSPWHRTDEWYEFRSRPDARVLLRLDDDHPLAWCHERLGGRAFYTALGHTIESYAEPAFRAHLSKALRWVTNISTHGHR